MKKIFVAPLPQLLPANWAKEKTLAIVIDTLRFTSTACVALKAGAKEVHVAAEVETARELAAKIGTAPRALLCGERHCHPIEGFDLGNSPFEYTPDKVANHPLIFSTTNGTRAVEAALPASQIILASLLNRAAVANYIVQSDYPAIWIICAGTDGQIALEDMLTAGAILLHDQIAKRTFASNTCEMEWDNDAGLIAASLFQRGLPQTAESRVQALQSGGVSLQEISAFISKAAGGQNLISAGYQRDIAAVAELDALDIVPHNTSKFRSTFVAIDNLPRG